MRIVLDINDVIPSKWPVSTGVLVGPDFPYHIIMVISLTPNVSNSLGADVMMLPVFRLIIAKRSDVSEVHSCCEKVAVMKLCDVAPSGCVNLYADSVDPIIFFEGD